MKRNDAVQGISNTLQDSPMKERPQAHSEGRAPWSACPKCGVDLNPIRMERKRACLAECPYCYAQILPVWWQRFLWAGLSLFLSFGLTIKMMMPRWDVALLVGSFLSFPVMFLAASLTFSIVPPKYVLRRPNTITLFQR